jgi:expansin
MKFWLVPLVLLSATLGAFCQPDSGNIVHTGQATYYNATGDGACMFGPSPGNLMVCAMDSAEYDTAAVCGASIHVVGPSGEVTVRIVDLCPECPRGNVDLSKQAFAKIADTILGRVSITWRYVETSVTGPIAYRIKTGSNPWWVGIQILYHRNPIVKLEADSAGKWIAIPRMSYNYFVDASGLGPGPYSFRVTDLYGQQLTDANIPLSPDVITPGAANFPSHSAKVMLDAAPRFVRGGMQTALRTVIDRGRLLGPGEKGPVDVYRIDGSLVGRFTGAVNEKFQSAAGVYLVKPATNNYQGCR